MNYQVGMTAGEIMGIINLDGTATLYDNDGRSQQISLHTCLYQKVSISPKESIYAEIHFERPGNSVEIVYANTPEGEAKVEMINKQVVGYL